MSTNKLSIMDQYCVIGMILITCTFHYLLNFILSKTLKINFLKDKLKLTDTRTDHRLNANKNWMIPNNCFSSISEKNKIQTPLGIHPTPRDYDLNRLYISLNLENQLLSDNFQLLCPLSFWEYLNMFCLFLFIHN